MKRSILIALIVAVAAVAGWAQDATGDHRPGEAPDGQRPDGQHADEQRPGGFFQTLDPEILLQRMLVEVEIWDRYLSLTDEQESLVLDLVQTHFTNLTELVTGGVRPDPESMQVLQEEKAFAIYELLNAEQQAIMQYYYEEITAEILAGGRTGPGGGFRQSQ
ncbi:MAG: hypothetical protein V3S41_02710 [Spirochaetia bacterium]